MPSKEPIIYADKENLDNLANSILAKLINNDYVHKRDVVKVQEIVKEKLKCRVTEAELN